MKRHHLFRNATDANNYIAKVEAARGYPLPARKEGGDIDAGETELTTKFADPIHNTRARRYAVPEDTTVAAPSAVTTKELDDAWMSDTNLSLDGA